MAFTVFKFARPFKIDKPLSISTRLVQLLTGYRINAPEPASQSSLDGWLKDAHPGSFIGRTGANCVEPGSNSRRSSMAAADLATCRSPYWHHLPFPYSAWRVLLIRNCCKALGNRSKLLSGYAE